MLNFPFIFIIPDKCETLEIARGSRPGRGVQLSHFSRREEGRATLFCSTLFPSGSLMTRANRPRNDLRNFRNDAQVRGRKRCRYHCSNCGLYCLERNVASSNYPPVLLLEPRWVITVNGSVFVLLKDYTCVYVCEMEKGRRNYYLYR